jgi:hypothetical protein
MKAYVIRFPGGRMLQLTWGDASKEQGWRPYTWTDSIEAAEKFDSPEQAQDWAAKNLRHNDFTIDAINPNFGPNNPVGGSTIAMRAAA